MDVDTPEDLQFLEKRCLEVRPAEKLSAEAGSPLADHAAPVSASFVLCKTPAELEDLRFTLPGRSFTFAVRTAGILIHEGRVLLQKTIGKNEYYLPGGHVQPFETTEQTLIRELREELHSEVEILDFAGIGENFFPWEGRTIQQLCFYYRVRFRMEAPGIPTEGRFAGFDRAETERYHLEYVWVPLPELEIPGRIRLFPEKSRPMITGKHRGPVHFTDTQ